MKPIDKDGWLTQLEQLVDTQIQAAITFQELPETVLCRPSDTGGWSVVQCLAHLNTYGHYYLPRIRRVLANASPESGPSVFAASWLGAYLNRLMDPTTSRQKFKAIKKHQPVDLGPPHQVITDFIEQQRALRDLLRTARHQNIGQGRIPLSIARWVRLPLGDILQFMVVHAERHIRQAQRNVLPAVSVNHFL